jgi:hypothetical protein
VSPLDIHSPHCEVRTGRTGTVAHVCDHGAIVRDASICGATKPCPVHGGEFPTEEDVPIDLRRQLLKAASEKQINYYWLCALYRKGATDARASLDPSSRWQSITSAPKDGTRADAEAMAARLRKLIANPAFADTRPVLEIRLETIETLLNGPSPPQIESSQEHK